MRPALVALLLGAFALSARAEDAAPREAVDAVLERPATYVAGSNGNAIAGSNGNAIAGSNGNAIAGSNDNAVAGSNGNAIAGSNAEAVAGEDAANTLLGRPDDPAGPLGRDDGDLTALFWQSVAAVVVILVVAGVALVLIKRVMPRLGQARGKRLRLVETLYLGPQRSIHIVEADGRCLVVGASRDGVRLLDRLDSPRKFEIPADAASSDAAATASPEAAP
jgi:flagellar biogenesis protein FliO